MPKDFELAKATADRNNEAREAEANEEVETAIDLYEQNIKDGYADPFAFGRLMILYRKQKKYKDELRVINRAIKIFADQYAHHQKELLTEAHNKKKVQELSKAIMKKSGLQDRKGNDTYVPEPIGKWMKRKEVVEKRMQRKK